MCHTDFSNFLWVLKYCLCVCVCVFRDAAMMREKQKKAEAKQAEGGAKK